LNGKFLLADSMVCAWEIWRHPFRTTNRAIL